MRHYEKRVSRDVLLVDEFIESVTTFFEDRSLVADHALEKKMSGLRSFSINEQIRVIYRETTGEITFLDIGTHEQVYIR